MSDSEIVKVIKIETAGGEQTVKGLKEEINSLRDALLNCEQGSEEYKDILNQLISDQTKLTTVMNAGQKQASAMEGSYNALTNQLSALKKAWKETTDEATRADLGKQIKDINGKLGKMDGSIGDFRRNVGNYTQSIQQAFGKTGAAMKGLTGPIQGVGGAMKALAANPIMLAFTALAALIAGIIKGFKSSEENMNKLKTAMAAFEPVINAITKAFQFLAKGVADAFNWIGKLFAKMGKKDENGETAAQRSIKLKEREIALEKKKRENTEKNSKLEAEASELKAKAADKENYSTEQRLQFLQEAQDKEEEIAKNELAALEEEYALIVERNKLTESTTEQLNAQAQAYAAIQQAQTRVNNLEKKNNKERAKLLKEAENDRRNALNAMYNLEKSFLEQEYELEEDSSDRKLDLAKQIRKKELDIEILGLKEKVKNKEQYDKALKLLEEKYQKDIDKLIVDANRRRIDVQQKWDDIYLNSFFREGTSKYFSVAALQVRITLDEMQKALNNAKDNMDWMNWGDDNFQDFLKRIQETRNKLDQLNDSLITTTANEVEIYNQTVLYGIQPEMLKKYVELQQMQEKWTAALKNGPLSTEDNNQFLARMQAMFVQISALKKELNASTNELARMGVEASKVQKRFEEWTPGNILEPFANFDGGTMAELKNSADIIAKMFTDTFKNEITVFDEATALKNAREFIEKVRNQEGSEKAADEKIRLLQLLGIDNLDETTGAVLKKIKDTFLNVDPREYTTEMVDQLYQLVEAGIVPQEVLDNYINSIKNVAKAEEAVLQQRINNWSNLGSHIGDTISAIGDFYAQDLENRKANLEKNNKYDKAAQKELAKQYKKVQAAKIAQATIDTLQGALAAFMGYQELGQPWGAVLGAAAMTATLAMGAAQIHQIASTNPYEDKGSSLSSPETSTVMPSLNDYTPTYSATLTGQQETTDLANALSKQKLYVSVTDIEDKERLTTIRADETSY